jgi:tetratricopeptide (TPR) repeat protein
MRRPRMLVELCVILSIVALLAAWYHKPAPEGEDPSYQQVRLQLQRDWSKGNLVGCMRACQELLAQDPNDLLALRYLGLLALRQGDERKALEFFNRGIALHNKNQGDFADFFLGQRMGCLFRDRARLYVSQKRWKEAIADAEVAKKMLMLAGADGELADDVYACAQYGAGNTDYPTPSEWNDNPINALIARHRSKLTGETFQSRHKPVWHPSGCPLCP